MSPVSPSRRAAVRLIALLGVLGLAGSACNNPTPFAAIVNGVTIGLAEVEDELASIAANEEYRGLIEAQGQAVRGEGAGTFDAGFAAQVLTRRIAFELVAAELAAREVEVTDADLAAAEEVLVSQVGGPSVFDAFAADYRANLVRRTAEVSVLQAALADAPTGPDAARAYYDANPEEFEEACARHILVETEEEAAGIIAELAAGADFAEIARTRSVDTGSGANGGDLGCAPRGVYVAEFEQAIFEGAVGDLLGPVETQFGFHVIRVDERQLPPFEEVEDQVTQRLAQADQQAFSDWLVAAFESAEVEVNPRFGEWSSGGFAGPGVVAPEAPARPIDPDDFTGVPDGLPIEP